MRDVQAPTEYTTMHNNLLYYATQSNIPFVISSDIQADEDLNIFVDKKLITKDSVYLLVNYRLSINPLLKILGFIGENYNSSVELASNKPILKTFLSRRGIPVPEFTIGLPLDSGYPCILRKSDATSSSGLYLVGTEDELFGLVENKDSPVIEKIIGLEKDIPISYMVWTYFYKPVAIIAKIVRECKTHKEWIFPARQNVFYIPLFPRESISLESFKTVRAKDINTYHPDYVQDFLTIAETNKTLQAFSMDNVPFTYEAASHSMQFNHEKIKKWGVYNLAEAVSKILRLGFCRVDIKLDEKKAPNVLDVKTYSGYHSPLFPFHLLNKFPSDSEHIWYMIHKYYNLFGKFSKCDTVPERLE